MSNLALVCVIVGILAIIFRSPMIFIPETTMEFFKKLIEKDSRLRILGVFFSVIWLAMVLTAWSSDQPGASVILILGCIFGVITVFFLLLFPSAYRAIAELFVDMDSKILRGIGVIGVIMGIVFIYLGLAVF